MPIIKSAIKRAKQTIKRRERNIVTKRSFRDAIKEFNAAPTAATLSAAQSALDTAVKKNVLEKRTASRRKAQLSKIAKEAGVKLATGTKKAAPAKAAAKPAAKAAPKATTAKPATKAAAKPAAAKKPAAKKPAAKK